MLLKKQNIFSFKFDKNKTGKETEIFGKSMKARFIHGHIYPGTLKLEVNFYLIKEIENIHSGSDNHASSSHILHI